MLFKIELFNDTEALDDDLDKSRDKELLSMGLRFSFGDDDDDDDDDRVMMRLSISLIQVPDF